VKTLCRDCGALETAAHRSERCDACGSPRLVCHAELGSLAVAHVDCDAFYAAVEKRDRPELADRPVIIGGGARGVVLACCYVARLYGVRSAMPMFRALAACPDAVVIRPDMAKYRVVGREVRAEMQRLTPLVEPLSIDEAFLHLGGTEALHEACPAQLLAGLAKRVETAHGITVSIGLSDNKFLAKIASDLDKPRGFAVLSRREAPASWPANRSHCCGASERRCSGDSPGTELPSSASSLKSATASSPPVMAGWAYGSLTWPAAKTIAQFSHMPRSRRSRPKPLWRRTGAMRTRCRTHYGRFASASRPG